MRHSEKSVTSIAFETGFNSLSSFERIFRKKFGVSPIKYRKMVSFKIR
ncbi:helix-turn-helix domain-containing protein [Thermoactinomyces daqus]|nr:helix-turn-helix domain-containing protein [Thermoactinomyces daqus]